MANAKGEERRRQGARASAQEHRTAAQERHRLSVRALGLRKLNDVRELNDSPSVRGLINQVSYLVRIEESA